MTGIRDEDANEGEEIPVKTSDESEGSLEIGDEMAKALAEASESIDVLRSKDAGAGASSADKMTIELLSQELQALKAEYEATKGATQEAEERFLRLQAEFENFRRRTLKERQDAFHYGHQNLVKDLLSTVDNLERALQHGEQSGDGDFRSLLQGVELVHREFLGALAKHGVTVIEANDQAFDPAVHEAMAQVPNADVPPNTVIQVLQPGYMLRDRMIRPARVVVSKADDSAGGQATGPIRVNVESGSDDGSGSGGSA